jgi:hypothetical protein
MVKNTLSICKQSEWQLLGGVNGGWVQYDEHRLSYVCVVP